MYRDYLNTLSQRFSASFSTIQGIYGFDYGPEFEIALADVLRSALPSDYGICRGHAISASGEYAGDDIFIYDHRRLPTLGVRDEREILRRDRIPIEAVYSYVEAKHSIVIKGDGDSSLSKACKQVSKVKELCAKRRPSPLNISDLPEGMDLAAWGGGTPQRLDPVFGMVVARNVREKEGSPIIDDPSEIRDLVEEHFKLTGDDHFPDAIIFGQDVFAYPYLESSEGGKAYVTPFYIPKKSDFAIAQKPGHGFPWGFVSLMYALEFIKLGPMPWRDILGSSLFAPDDSQDS